jgi:hypothetical protein
MSSGSVDLGQDFGGGGGGGGGGVTSLNGSTGDLSLVGGSGVTVTPSGNNITIASGPAGPAAAGTLTGTTLASNVVASSLTSLGYLTNIAVAGSVGIGTQTPAAPLDIEATTTATSGTLYGLKNHFAPTPASTSSAQYEGFSNLLAVPLGNSNNMYLLKSGYNELDHNGTGTLTYATALGAAVYNAQLGVIQNAYGTYLGVYNNNGGTINTGYGTFIDTPNNSSNPGSMGTWYGLYISNSTLASTNYAIYSQGGINHFGGQIQAASSINLSTVQTTYSGSTSGTAVWSMPFQGSSYKKFLIQLVALTDAGGIITFPTPFLQLPYLYGASTATAVVSASTTTLTLSPTTAISGFVFIEGY